MRFWAVKQETSDPFADFDAMMRREDPDYDDKQRVRLENVQLRERRDFLRQKVENYELRQEIAELEAWEGA